MDKGKYYKAHLCQKRNWFSENHGPVIHHEGDEIKGMRWAAVGAKIYGWRIYNGNGHQIKFWKEIGRERLTVVIKDYRDIASPKK